MANGRTVRLDGAAVSRLRAEKGLNVEALADLAGCSAKTVRRVEDGRPAYLFTVRGLARALEVEPAALLLDPPLAPLPGKTYEVTLRLTTPFDQFDAADDLAALLRSLAARIGGLEQMEPKRVTPGSTLVTLEVTAEQLVRVLRGFAEGHFDALGVVEVQALAVDPAPGRPDMPAGGKEMWATAYPQLARQLGLRSTVPGGWEMVRFDPAITQVTLEVTAEQLLNILAEYVEGRLDGFGVESVAAPLDDSNLFQMPGNKRVWRAMLPLLAKHLGLRARQNATES